MAVSGVNITADAYLVCLTHAMSTEKEEIMGLLIGEVSLRSLSLQNFPDQDGWAALLFGLYRTITSRRLVTSARHVGSSRRVVTSGRHVGSSHRVVTSDRHVGSSRRIVTSDRHVGSSRSAVYNKQTRGGPNITVTTLMWVTARYAHPAWRTPLQVRVYLYQYLL